MRLVDGQGVGDQAAGQVRTQVGVGHAGQLFGGQTCHAGKALVGVEEAAVKVVEHNTGGKGGIDAVHNLFLLVDHAVEAAQLVGHGAFVAAYQPPPEGSQHDACQGREHQGGQQGVFTDMRVLGLQLRSGHALGHQPGQAGYGFCQTVALPPVFGQGVVFAHGRGQAAVFQLPAGQVVAEGLQDGRFASMGNGLDHGRYVGAEQQHGGHADAGSVHVEGGEHGVGHVHDQQAVFTACGQKNGLFVAEGFKRARALGLVQLGWLARGQENFACGIEQRNPEKTILFFKITQLPQRRRQARGQGRQGRGGILQGGRQGHGLGLQRGRQLQNGGGGLARVGRLCGKQA